MDIKQQHALDQLMGQVRDAAPNITLALKLYYDSLVSAGFTPEQAIYLVGVHGTSFGYKECK